MSEQEQCGFSNELVGRCLEDATETLEVEQIATGRRGEIRACKKHADKFESDSNKRKQ